ncbi:MAG: InlB B-repeat-containing protein [Bacteroidota bacterium]
MGQSELVELQVRSSPSNAGISSPPSREFNSGENVTLRAIPDPHNGYIFHRWGGDLESRENPVEFRITSDLQVVAYFVPRPWEVTITIQGEGLVEHRPAYTDEPFREEMTTYYGNGQRMELRAKPAPGWEFVQWRGENFTFNRPANPEIMNVFKDQKVTAIFREVSQ